MKIGLQIPRFDWPGSPHNLGAKLADIACTADDAGFASVWVMDHYFQIDGGGMGKAEDPMLEGYSALNFLAVMWFLSMTPEKGAETSIYLASSAEVEGVTGKYFVNKKEAQSAEKSYDETAARRMWQGSAELTKLDGILT